MIGIPESPRYLVQKGLTQRAKAVIEKTLHEPADQVIARIQSSLVNTHQGKLSELFDRHTILLPIIWTGVMLAIFQQFVGINVIFFLLLQRPLAGRWFQRRRQSDGHGDHLDHKCRHHLHCDCIY